MKEIEEKISNPKNKFWKIVGKIALIALSMVIKNQKGIKGTDATIIIDNVSEGISEEIDKQ